MVMFSAGCGTLRNFAAFLVSLSSLYWVVPTLVSATSELEMSGFVIVQETDSGRWEIEAYNASYVDEKDVLLDGVSARMVSDGEERIRVESKTGRFDSERLVLHLEGNVIITSNRGLSLKAPVVRWEGSEDYLEASGGVELQRGSIVVYGSKGRYTIKTGTAWISGKVRTVLGKRKQIP